MIEYIHQVTTLLSTGEEVSQYIPAYASSEASARQLVKEEMRRKIQIAKMSNNKGIDSWQSFTIKFVR